MCGRFVQTSSSELLTQRFGAVDATAGALRARFNVAPSTPVPVVLAVDGPSGPTRRLGVLRWGFVPTWARDPDAGPRPINARVEGAAGSRLFAPALARRRCIVPIDAWYEWADEGGARQPWLLRPSVPGPVAVAALWSTWRGPSTPTDTPPLGTVALMTTEAKGRAASVHDRMPLLVPDEMLDGWLAPDGPVDPGVVGTMRTVQPDIEVVRVSRRVNDVRNDDAELLHPVES